MIRKRGPPAALRRKNGAGGFSDENKIPLRLSRLPANLPA